MNKGKGEIRELLRHFKREKKKGKEKRISLSTKKRKEVWLLSRGKKEKRGGEGTFLIRFAGERRKKKKGEQGYCRGTRKSRRGKNGT